MMCQAPFGHNRTAARHNTGNTLGCQRHISQQHPGMNGEVVHALFSLLDQSVTEHFPGQVFRHAANFFQCLINRYGTNGHHGVTDNPLAGFMDVFARGQIHHGVCTPARCPCQFFNFFFDG